MTADSSGTARCFMKIARFARAPVLATVLAGPATLQAAPDSLSTIRELVEQGQYERAYEHALAAEERYEGNPDFDFYYGLAALEAGHYGEAVFALERVVFAQPDQLRVRLELARAHYLAGNYPAASAEFQRVLDEDPPPSVRANIERFQRNIEVAQRSRRRDIGGWFDARVGADSNINSATEAETIATPLGDFTLVEDGREQQDQFARLEASAYWREPLTKDSALDVSARWQQKDNFSSDAFDLGIGVLEGGWTRDLDNGRVRLGGRLQHVRLDGERFQDGYGLVGSYDRGLGRNWVLALSGSATALRFDDDAGRDVDQFLASATLVRPAGQYVHSFTFYGALEPAQSERGDFNGRNFYGAIYGLTFDAGQAEPFLRFGLQSAEFDDDHPVFAEVRDDTTLTAAAGVRWTVADSILLTAQANYTDVDSNLPVFAYDRLLMEFGLRRNF
ncbi:MAG: tetratricopeptide repeat protein [Pseudomonadales bacterium]|nr:tetratricopeptide repeat protein [Pseudomonadales bacterium]